jgi:hypothetical protein
MTTQTIDFLEIVAFILEAAGIVLLFREVRIAQKLEGLHHDLAKAEQAEVSKAALDERETHEARETFARQLADWFERSGGMAPDVAYPFALKVLGLNQSPRRENWAALFITKWTTPLVLSRREKILKLGAGLLLFVVLIHAGIFFFDRKPEPLPPVSASTAFKPIGPAIAFDSGQALLTYSFHGKAVDLTPSACNVKKALLADSARQALVIGRHDQTQLGKAAREAFSSNQALAQQRAEAVMRYLSENNPCGIGIHNVIALVAGPRVTGKAALPPAALAKDRVVEVWGIGP